MEMEPSVVTGSTVKQSKKLLKVNQCIPSRFQTIFPFETFNCMQSALVYQSFNTDVNMIVAAPTGSGKTIVHELAICRLIESKGLHNIKCVLIAPNKALCQQRWSEWNVKFNPLGLSVLEVTGDVDVGSSLKMVARASIIITTPEKWDALTRIWREHVFLLSATDLLLVDEIHHLGEDRGPVLETVIVRMRFLADARSKELAKTSNDTSANNHRYCF